ncbi:MAG: ATP-binding protein [Verrucomicrobiota bacterium]
MKAGFLEKLIEKVDRVEPGEVQSYLVRLMQERGFLERVFEALQEGVVVMDAEGTVSFMNGAAGDFFGLKPEEVVGESLRLKLPGLEWERLRESQKVVSRDLEVFYPENRFLNVYVAPIEDETLSDQVLGRVMIVRDITKERKVEEEKIESETLNVLTMLAAGVAHELGNPLNSLNIHLQLAQRKLGKVPEAVRKGLEEVLEIARKEIQRLDLIIGHFLTAVRPTAPQLAMEDVNLMLQESLQVLQPEIEDRKIEVRVEFEQDLPLLLLDAVQIKQAFYNLIRNASQALGSEGELHIRTSADDARIAVEFVDNGVGISAKDMANLFRPYYTTKTSGSGLGLLIVRRIIREHGGEMEMESEVELGTRVTCYLPRVEKRMRLLETQVSAGNETVIDV